MTRPTQARLRASLALLTLAAATLAFVPTPPASAKSKLDGMLVEAKKAADEARFGDAIDQLGRAAAAAHKKGDLAAEDRIARAIDTVFESSIGMDQFGMDQSGVATGGAAAPADQHRSLLAALMSRLDPARNAAFVSARVLATELLLRATASGDHEHVAEAAKVLRLHAKRKRSGAAGPACAAYAEGLVALADGKPKAATAPLGQALEAASLHGWLEFGTHVGVELAANSLALEDNERAKSALTTVGQLFGEVPSGMFRTTASALMTRRLKDAPDDVLAPLKTAIAPDGTASIRSGMPTGTTGGDLGLGKAKNTEIGRALGKWSRSKPLVVATRGLPGTEIELRFLDGWKRVVPLASALRVVGDGGLKLAIRGPSIGVHRVDVENEMSQGLGRGAVTMGSGSQRISRARALYLVGMGETWSLSKTGEVTIAPLK